MVYRSYVGMTEAKKNRSRFPFIGLACGLAVLLGCDSYSDLRASLDPSEQAQFARGQREATACWSCHDVTGSALKVGPPLGEMMGRRVGAVPGFPYSDALRGSDVVWTEQNLDAFLGAPQRLFPGNRMISPALREPQRRADLIFFLKQVNRPKAAPGVPRP